MTNFIQIDDVFTDIRAAEKEKIFQALSEKFQKRFHFPSALIFKKLMEKERKSPSAIGEGVAIPHAQIQGIPNRFVCLARLNQVVDFDAPDNKLIDIIGVLVSPESDGPLHLQGLSRLSRLLSNRELCDKIREARDSDSIKSLLIDPDGWLMAA